MTVVGDVNGGTKNLNNGSGAVIGGNVNSGFNLNGNPQTVQVGGSISNTNVNYNTVTSGLVCQRPRLHAEPGSGKKPDFHIDGQSEPHPQHAEFEQRADD